MLVLPALQSNSAGSVLTNDGRLGAEIRELKPGLSAPPTLYRPVKRLRQTSRGCDATVSVGDISIAQASFVFQILSRAINIK